MRRIVGVLLATAGLTIAVVAQEESSPGVFKPRSVIEAELAQSVSSLGVVAGQSTQVIGTDAGRIVVRRRQTGPNNASIHDDVTEIYYIVSGSGTLVTGGVMADPENRSAGVTGGMEQRVEVGDFVILPPGTSHWFSDIEGSITYMETRFTTEK